MKKRREGHYFPQKDSVTWGHAREGYSGRCMFFGEYFLSLSPRPNYFFLEWFRLEELHGYPIVWKYVQYPAGFGFAIFLFQVRSALLPNQWEHQEDSEGNSYKSRYFFSSIHNPVKLHRGVRWDSYLCIEE